MNWCEIAALCNIPAEVNTLVEELKNIFYVLYTWSFENVHDLEALNMMRRRVVSFVEDWRAAMGYKWRNYYHWLAHEALRQIFYRGSLWKYASDVTESFVHVVKDKFAKYTNRGGCKRHWTKQVLHRILIDVYVTTLEGGDGVDSLLSRHEKKRLWSQTV